MIKICRPEGWNTGLSAVVYVEWMKLEFLLQDLYPFKIFFWWSKRKRCLAAVWIYDSIWHLPHIISDRVVESTNSDLHEKASVPIKSFTYSHTVKFFTGSIEHCHRGNSLMTFVVFFWLKLLLRWKSDWQLLPHNGMYTYSNLWKSSCWKVRFWFVSGIINWLNLSLPKNLCNWPVHVILGTVLNRI